MGHAGRPSMGKRAIANAAEQDAFTDWRHVVRYVQRPGVRKWIKRQSSKRERRSWTGDQS